MKVLINLSLRTKKGGECQDKTSVARVPNDRLTIFALSDGAGSAPFSAKGAQTITQGFTKHLRRWVFLNRQRLPQRAEFATSYFISGMQEALQASKEEVIKLSLKERRPITDYLSTFIGGIAYEDPFGKRVVTFLSVGDSVLITFDENFEITYKSAITNGEYPNETTFVQLEESVLYTQVGVIEDPKYAFISSDGLDGIFYRQRFKKENPTAGSDLEKYKWEVEPLPNLKTLIEKVAKGEAREEELKKFLSDKDVNMINRDDKSLIIIEL
jgi:hypothetical protein